MKRLTTKFPNGYLFNLPSVNDEKAKEEYVDLLSKKLGEYEDAEEQGLLIRFHCKVGDTVYEIHPLTNRITERIINSIVICNASNLIIMYKSGYDYSILHDDFGKTVFLTREEAEQALEAMKGGGEC